MPNIYFAVTVLHISNRYMQIKRIFEHIRYSLNLAE